MEAAKVDRSGIKLQAPSDAPIVQAALLVKLRTEDRKHRTKKPHLPVCQRRKNFMLGFVLKSRENKENSKMYKPLLKKIYVQKICA